MIKFSRTVKEYRELLESDDDISKSDVEPMVKRYAIAKSKYMTVIIRQRKDESMKIKWAPVYKQRAALRDELFRKFGFVDEEYICQMIPGPTPHVRDFNPFTEDPNCKSCGKGNTDDERRNGT